MIAGPARIPPAIVDRLNREFNAVLHMPYIRERLAAAGSTVTGGTSMQAQEILKSELAKFRTLVVEAGLAQDALPR